ncbi:MAG: hypothetical protein OEY97_05870 [Nitrospirota bacterium]|nr:hypothetical protein [Nitrospirota bacterium]
MKATIWLVLLSALLAPVPATAITLEAADSRVSILGYMDLQYSFMERLPTCSTGCPTITSTPVVSSLDSSRANLILRVDREQMRAAVNLFSGNGYQSDGSGSQGRFEVMEAYGEYRHGPGLILRGGTFLAPFGIYNEIRYAISLFAPVVLSTAYEPLPDYAASGGLPHLVPDAANGMVSGALGAGALDYALYVGSGERQASGMDENRDKAVGGRLQWHPSKSLSLGASAYTANDDPLGTTIHGRRRHGMLSLDWHPGNTTVQWEYLRVTCAADTVNAHSQYLRVSHRIGRVTPFVGYDHFQDRPNPLYADGMARWSAGTGIEVSPNVYLKAEYHYHHFETAAVAAAGLDRAQMVRLAAIVVF